MHEARISALSLLESVIRAEERGIDLPADLFDVKQSDSFNGNGCGSNNSGGLEDIEDDTLSPSRRPLATESSSSLAPSSLSAGPTEPSVPYRKESWNDVSPNRAAKKKGRRPRGRPRTAGDHLFHFNTSSVRASTLRTQTLVSFPVRTTGYDILLLDGSCSLPAAAAHKIILWIICAVHQIVLWIVCADLHHSRRVLLSFA